MDRLAVDNVSGSTITTDRFPPPPPAHTSTSIYGIYGSTTEKDTTPPSCWSWVVRIVRTRMAFRPPVESDPRRLPPSKKRLILACLSLGSSLNGFCSTVYFPGIPAITTDLQASTMSITLTTSLFVLFGGIGPIMWASMSDFYHVRRFLYLISLLIFTVATMGCALVTNVWVLVVLRCIQSVGTSVTMSVGAGTVADCWEITERGTAFSILFVGQFIGPLIGPIAGGGLTTGFGWRSTFWFCCAYGLFLFCFQFLFLPETYRIDRRWDGLPEIKVDETTNNNEPVLDTISVSSTAATVSESRPPSVIASSSSSQQQRGFNPFKSVAMLRHLFVLFIAVEIGVCFGTMFTIETIIPDLYADTYNFQSWQTGLAFLGGGIGNILGSIVSGRLSDFLLKRAREKRGGAARTEDRLTLNAWPGGYILMPLGVLAFGWSVAYGISVWVPIVSFGVVCFGMSQVYASASAYLVDSIPGKGASVTAASNMFRMTVAFVLSLIAHPVLDGIGVGYFTVILAALGVIGMTLFLLVKLYGPRMRRRAGYGDDDG